jgi:hypothetical protein
MSGTTRLNDNEGNPINASGGIYETVKREADLPSIGANLLTTSITPIRKYPCLLVVFTPKTSSEAVITATYTLGTDTRVEKLYGGSEIAAGVGIATEIFPQEGEKVYFTCSITSDKYSLTVREL